MKGLRSDQPFNTNGTPKWKNKRQTAICISLIIAVMVFCFGFHRINTMHHWWYLQNGDPFKVDHIEPEGQGDVSTTFQLRHVFHRGTGTHNHRYHGRLDITAEYLEEHKEQLANINSVQSTEVDENNLEEVYNVFDWPQAHAGKNPWTIQLPIKRSHENGRVVRLKERHTPNFLDSYLSYAMSVKGNPALLNKIHLEWDEEREIPIPDVHDKDTVVSLATISSNAYVKLPKSDDDKKRSDWVDVGDPWVPDDRHHDVNFGWEDDGLRGHVFVSTDNKTVVIGIKGTSGAGFIGSGPEETTANDKTNDNLLFSCCCARVGYMWTTVCDCYQKAYTCDQDCLERELMRQDRYYQATLDLYRNVTKIYPPDSTNIWVTGHSLGGALAALAGRTYGLPAVSFEAPGEMLAARRLHLPQPPGLPRYMENIWHFGNTADPIFMGVCNGVSSSCNVAGYAMETACHSGKQCVYDVVSDLGWRVNLLNHRIHTVIDDIILAYNETAPCSDSPPCKDCFNWRFVSRDDSRSNEPSLPNPLVPVSSRAPHPSPSSYPSRSSRKPRSSRPPRSPHSAPSRSSAPKHSLFRPSSLAPTYTRSSCSFVPSTTPSHTPRVCLHRSWYGRCIEWGHNNV